MLGGLCKLFFFLENKNSKIEKYSVAYFLEKIHLAENSNQSTDEIKKEINIAIKLYEKMIERYSNSRTCKEVIELHVASLKKIAETLK